jgi:hypothetical protein
MPALRFSFLGKADLFLLDEQLLNLLTRMTGPKSRRFDGAARLARAVIDAAEGRLIPAGWKADWSRFSRLAWAGFGDVDHNSVARHFYEVFVGLVPLALGEVRAHRAQKHLEELAGLLEDYLDARGHELPGRGASAVAAPSIGRKPTINARMTDALQRNLDSRDWPVRKWADYLNCSLAAVHGTCAWKMLMETRERAKLERLEQQQARRGESGHRRGRY